MRPNKIVIEIVPEMRTIQVLAGDRLITLIETVRDQTSGYFVRSQASSDWDGTLLDRAEECPQMVDLYDVLCHGEEGLFPELQDILQWIAEEDRPIKPEFGIEIELDTQRANER